MIMTQIVVQNIFLNINYVIKRNFFVSSTTNIRILYVTTNFDRSHHQTEHF